ncbi:hypothetical protein B0T22DRAFT_497511 [Podospora appendiculata]|uniref:tRNA (uracil-O(2)-)-methyltransferase n=1 Tax=Podospora appendiculata TaxID=314037 RepID=A0AAE0XL95_9PEZI|nr:hypothetical protein B0T22DRAFT_497511 [Podospora appendiculata]
MVFKPEELAVDASPLISQSPSPSPNVGVAENADMSLWRPLLRHECTFDPDIFTDVMVNLIKNPNINSSWLFRADILHDAEDAVPWTAPPESEAAPAVPPAFLGFECRRYMVRRMIPRNTLRDKPLDQTCLIYESSPVDDADHDAPQKTLVVYLPHVSSAAEMPFYHPEVRAIAFLHEWTASESRGSISISYVNFDDESVESAKNSRTAFHLLQVLYKHGEGRASGYQKRVHHDVLLPQARVQNTYTTLKQKYARELINGWAETTDPGKHVFEDLCIAAFMIELWADMYGQGPFPGFVDIGCGNGLLVNILNKEGYSGWGFDARERKSWASYNTRRQLPTGSEDSLQQRILLPPPVGREGLAKISSDDFMPELIHDGIFPKGTFIISNHADELTPWTPILATISDCPFIMIPCCSHDLTGSRYRAPPPKGKKQPISAYASLVSWVSEIAKDCGWEVEQEMLRIPSTRNTAIVGRRRSGDSSSDIQAIVQKYGGTAGYLETVTKLAKKPNSGNFSRQDCD